MKNKAKLQHVLLQRRKKKGLTDVVKYKMSPNPMKNYSGSEHGIENHQLFPRAVKVDSIKVN
eukprot:snap_masked-scaffold_6-processed-gene-18.21-mRNA-1 protein AED:1.00 eAED:1.00 QI:0/0/0/0/1/1/2/0/61